MVESYHDALCVSYTVSDLKQLQPATIKRYFTSTGIYTFCESSVSFLLRVLDFDCQKEKESLKRHLST